MKTFLGLEANFCRYCARRLELVKDGISWYAECPKRRQWWGFKFDVNHTVEFLGVQRPRYDITTGELLPLGAEDLTPKVE